MHTTITETRIGQSSRNLSSATRAIFKEHEGHRIGGVTIPMPPAREGGDSIAAVRVHDGMILLLLDAAGKGQLAAPLGRFMQAVAFSAISSGLSDPIDILRKLNLALCEIGAVGAAAVLHCNHERVLAAAAGSPAPVFFHGSEMGVMAAGGTLLGCSRRPEFDAATLTVREGTLLTVFSDGVTEAENTMGELFDPAQFSGILDPGRSTAANVLGCVDAVLAHSVDQQDDISLVLLHMDDPLAVSGHRAGEIVPYAGVSEMNLGGLSTRESCSAMKSCDRFAA